MSCTALLAMLLLAAKTPDAGLPMTTQSKPERELPASVVFGRVARSTMVVEVTLKSGKSQGSGVVVAPERLVTNHHVVANGRSIEVRQGDKRWSAELVAFDPKRDLALLKVPGLELPKVSLRPSARVQVGERVYAVGSPRGLELTLSDGLVSALRQEKGGTLIQTTAPVSPGSSGGGLFDAQGRLVGIVTFSAAGQNLNFAMPTDWIVELLGGPATPDAGVNPAARPSWTVTERPEDLRCHLTTRATWGVFSGGSEMLESEPVDLSWTFRGLNTQLAKCRLHPTRPSGLRSLVLSDLNRERGFVVFTDTEAPSHQEYFFSFGEEGEIEVAFLEPTHFHGQLRLLATTGDCQPEAAPSGPPRRVLSSQDKAPIEKGESSPPSAPEDVAAAQVREAAQLEHEGASGEAAMLYRKACEQGNVTGCDRAARLYESIGQTETAKSLRKRGDRFRSK